MSTKPAITPSKKSTPSSEKNSTKTQPSLNIAPNQELPLTLTWSTIEPIYQKAVRRYARDVKIDGFRKGKVPAAMVESMINQSALVEYVLEKVLPEAYSAAIAQAKKHPITQPEIDPVRVEKGSDWQLKVYFAEAPTITLGDYKKAVKKGLSLAAEAVKEQEATLKKNVEKKAKSANESTDADKNEAPAVKTTLTEGEKEELQTRHVFQQLVEAINPAVPELLVRREADRELRRLVEQLDQLKVSVEKYLQSRQMDADQLRLEYLAHALASLQLEFVLAEIGKTEKITVEDKEVDETLERVFGKELTDAQRTNSEYRSYLFSTLVKQKIAKHLLSLK